MPVDVVKAILVKAGLSIQEYKTPYYNLVEVGQRELLLTFQLLLSFDRSVVFALCDCSKASDDILASALLYLFESGGIFQQFFQEAITHESHSKSESLQIMNLTEHRSH